MPFKAHEIGPKFCIEWHAKQRISTRVGLKTAFAAENLAKAEELDASMDHGAPTFQSGSQNLSQGAPCARSKTIDVKSRDAAGANSSWAVSPKQRSRG
jgi:hypothetical protein